MPLGAQVVCFVEAYRTYVANRIEDIEVGEIFTGFLVECLGVGRVQCLVRDDC